MVALRHAGYAVVVYLRYRSRLIMVSLGYPYSAFKAWLSLVGCGMEVFMLPCCSSKQTLSNVIMTFLLQVCMP
jgi:hypothetical protein